MSQVVTLLTRPLPHCFSLIWLNISSRRLLFPHGACIVSPSTPQMALCVIGFCVPEPQRAPAATQGKPSLHWHSFEHASRTTSHGLHQKKCWLFTVILFKLGWAWPNRQRPFYTRYFYITAFSVQAFQATAQRVWYDPVLGRMEAECFIPNHCIFTLEWKASPQVVIWLF